MTPDWIGWCAVGFLAFFALAGFMALFSPDFPEPPYDPSDDDSYEASRERPPVDDGTEE